MPAAKTKKFTPEIDAQLYDEFVAVAEKNGQTKRHVLDQVLDAFEQSVARNRDLLERLAK